MLIDWSILIGIGGGLFAILGYTVKKYIDLRLNSISQFHSKKFEAIVKIRGLLAEIEHSIEHLVKGGESYEEVLEQHCKSVRKESRAYSVLLGTDLIISIRNATDSALEYRISRKEDQLKRWKEYLVQIYDDCDKKICTVELNPKDLTRLSM